MKVRPDQRGVISGRLNLLRNLGLITGAFVIGAVFALGSAASSMIAASPQAVAAGMQITFLAATVPINAAPVIASISHARSQRAIPSRP